MKARAFSLIEVIVAGFLSLSVIGILTVGFFHFFSSSIKLEQKKAAVSILEQKYQDQKTSVFTRDIGTYPLEATTLNGKTFEAQMQLSPYKEYNTDDLRLVTLEITWESRTGLEKIERGIVLGTNL